MSRTSASKPPAGLVISPTLTLPIEAVVETFAIIAKRGKGKALATGTPLATPTGWTTMGEVQPGDWLFDDQGRPCRVTAVLPVYEDHQCYRVGFSDGSEIIADADHLWLTEDRPSRNADSQTKFYADRQRGFGDRPQCQRSKFPALRSTQEIRDTLRFGKRGDLNHSIVTATAIHLPEATLPIAPYLLGLWLGDGTGTAANITTADPEVLDRVADLGYRVGVNYNRTNDRTPTHRIHEGPDGLTLHRHLRTLGLFGKTHVPAAYLRASTAQRLELLRGLMDTDGWAQDGIAYFVSTDEWLADVVHELVVSLGWMARRRKKPSRLNGVEHKPAHLVNFRPSEQPFHLARKQDRLALGLRQLSRHRRRMIKYVEPIQSVPVRCIAVDSPSRLFLAGRDMIPTHNTNTAVVMAEEMIALGMPVLIIDPVGVWWGLRASADGKKDGLPIVIFGGDHADIALNEKAGVAIADAVIEGRFPAILDLSHLSKSAMRRFMADFVERLYHRNRDALHVIIDEADMFAPQRAAAEGARLLGAMEDLQRRGRARGIGTTLITQRPAVLHKDLLSQAEILICLGLTGVRDVQAIDEWVRLHADDEEAKTVKASLASLPVGTAWVWSPAWLGILQKVQIRPRTTFDSSATPRPGMARPTATTFARVDKEALGQRIADLEASAVADDPRALRARIAVLERQVAARQAPAKAAETSVEVRVEVPVLSDEQAQIVAAAAETVRSYAANASERAEHAAAQIKEQVALLTELLSEPTRLLREAASAPTRRPVPSPSKAKASPAVAAARPATRTRPAAARPDDVVLPKAQRRILTALAQQPHRTAKQVALLTSYSHKSGGFRNSLSALRSAGHITGSGTDGMDITEEGLSALGAYDPLPTGDALLDWWKDEHLGKAERAIVDVLRVEHPRSVSTDEIAERTDYSAASGGFRNALSRLRSFEIAAGRGELVLADEFVD